MVLKEYFIYNNPASFYWVCLEQLA